VEEEDALAEEDPGEDAAMFDPTSATARFQKT
jgi:hypothetical protein